MYKYCSITIQMQRRILLISVALRYGTYRVVKLSIEVCRGVPLSDSLRSSSRFTSRTPRVSRLLFYIGSLSLILSFLRGPNLIIESSCVRRSCFTFPPPEPRRCTFATHTHKHRYTCENVCVCGLQRTALPTSLHFHLDSRR